MDFSWPLNCVVQPAWRTVLGGLSPGILALLLAGTACAAEVPGASEIPARTLTFQQFFKTPIGNTGLETSPSLAEADGKKVQISGYMVQHELPTPGRFFLTPRPVQMSEYADGDADDLPPATLLVQLADEQQQWLVPHTRGRITVEGILHVGREESPQGRVTWVRLDLSPDAIRPMNPMQWLGYLHSLQHTH